MLRQPPPHSLQGGLPIARIVCPMPSTPRTRYKTRQPATAIILCAAGVIVSTLFIFHFWPRPEEKGEIPRSSAGASARASAPAARAISSPAVPEGDTATSAPTATPKSASTRREAAALVRALYRKEQLTRELDLEQRRYGRAYWQPEANGRELAQLQRERETMLAQLNAEANQVLQDLFPGETGEPIALPALFGDGRAGPALGFLPAADRARFEAEILASDDDRDGDAGHLLEIAQRLLPADEFAAYRQWNEPDTAALRAQLLGFDQTGDEFDAILQESRRTDAERATRAPGTGLEATLGTARFAAWRQLQDPAVHTALGDLNRLGLPLDSAAWLAAARAQAIAQISEVRQSLVLSDVAKQERVTRIERACSQAIAEKFALPAGSLDGLGPDS